MISKKMTDALNLQINKELYSAYLYLAMSAHAEDIGLKGFANWFFIQIQEEMSHAQKIYNYVFEQNQKVVLDEIKKPPADFKSPMDMFQKTLEHEQFVTKSINELVYLAKQEKDYATEIFLQWFVTEQIEEEGNDNEIIDKLRYIGDNGNGLLMLDKELGARTFVAPAAPSE
ncbi:MAG: ferritin [Candidatus Cloacimonetes bacterium]|nr:ferritin [Candidatus Cloacimonadota bacterium]